MTLKGKKVFVTGGTGFIGSHLVEALIKERSDIYCLVREDVNPRYLSEYKNKINFIKGELGKNKDYKAILKKIKPNIIYHVAALAGQRGHKEEEYWAVNYKAAVDLAKAAKFVGVERFIYCSSVGVMGNPKILPADEASPYNPTNLYEIAKTKAEKEIVEMIKKGFPAVVIRPAICYGPRNVSNMTRVFQSVAKGKYFIVGSGKNRWHLTYVSDVVDAFILASKKMDALGEIFIIAGPRPYTMNEFLQTMAKIMNVKPPKIHLPKLPLYIIGKLIFYPFEKKGIVVPFTHKSVMFLTNDRYYSTKKAEKILGFRPKIELEEGLRKTIRWYKENGFL